MRRRLAKLRVGLRFRLLGEGICWALVALVALVFVTLAFDYVLRLDRPQRAIVMAAAIGGVCYVIWRQLIVPLIVPMRETDLAMLIERRWGQLEDRFVSTLEFARSGVLAEGAESTQMVAAMARQADQLVRSLDFREVVERRNLRRVFLIFACAGVLMAGFAVWQSDVMRLWLVRNVAFGSERWPQKTYLRVEGGPDFSVLRGDDLAVVITAETNPNNPSPPPASVLVHAMYPSLGRIDPQKVDATAEGARTYVKVFRGVTEPFEFYVTGGDDRLDKNRPHKVTVEDPPELRELTFTVEYPPYMRRRAEDFGGMLPILSAPVGSWVRISGEATKDLQAASMSLELRLAREQRKLSAGFDEWVVRANSVTDQLSAMASGSEGLISAGQLDALKNASQHQVAVAAGIAKITKAQRALLEEAKFNPRPGAEEDIKRHKAGVDGLDALAERIKESADRLEALVSQDAAPSRSVVRALVDEQRRMLREADDHRLAMGELAKLLSQEMPMKRLSVDASGGTDGPTRGIYGSVYVSGRNRREMMNLVLHLTDTDGYSNRRGGTHVIRVRPDTPPGVEVRARGVGAIVTPNAKIPLLIEVNDDVGVRSAWMLVSRNAGKADTGDEIGPLPQEKTKFDLREEFDLAKLETRLKPGESLALGVEVSDTLPVEYDGPNNARSGMLDFRIVTPAELMAELIRRQKEFRKEFTQAIEMQETARAKSAAVHEALASSSVTPELRRRLEASGNLQGSVSAACAKIADSFEAIVTEMRNNRLGTDADHERIAAEIVRPLGELVEPTRRLVGLIKAAASVDNTGETRQQTRNVAELQEGIRVKMEEILDRMLKAESRQELAALLEDIINRSEALLRSIRQKQQGEIREVLEPDTQPVKKTD